MGYFGCLRVSEALDLTPDRWDFDVITFELKIVVLNPKHAKGPAAYHLMVISLKRTVLPHALFFLRQLKMLQGRQYTFGNPENPISGKTVFNLMALFKDKQKTLKTKKITFHSLRATHAVLMMETGFTIFEIQRAMRHRSPNTTILAYLAKECNRFLSV